MSRIRKLKETKLVIILNGFAFYGGASKPIFNYYKHSLNNGERVELIDLQSLKGVIKFILAAFFAPHILVNGLAAMNSWTVLLLCYFRRGVIFYCHEAEYAFEAFKTRTPLKFRLLKRIFPKLIVACVSKWQCDYISSTFKVKESTVVYNNIDLDTAKSLDATKTNIVMLGYLMHRKGVDLFSKVADLAAKTNPDMCFTWIGAGDTSGLYLSPNVNWIGEMLKPETLLLQTDLFFLSSMDDPFPLACLEALAYKKKCVVYRNTGTAEVIKDISGCAVFDEYSPEAAFEAILNALDAQLDLSKVEYVRTNVSSIKSFTKRLDSLLYNK